MSKKFYLLTCVVFVLALANGAAAQETRSWWSDLGATNDWNEPNNWWTADWNDVNDDWVKAAANSVPDINTETFIGKGEGWTEYPPELNDLVVIYGHTIVDPTIDGTVVAEVNYIRVGSGDDLTGNGLVDPCLHRYLTVTGGTLTIGANQDWEEADYEATDWYGWGMFNGQWGPGVLAIGACATFDTGVDGRGTMTMSGGVVNVGGHIEVGGWGATGLLNMLGGEMNIFQGVYCPSSWSSDTGRINLHGGTINARYIRMTESPYDDGSGVIDVTEGVMTFERDETDDLIYYEDYANVGLYGNDISITSYGTKHGEIITDSNYGAGLGKRAALVIDYDVVREGKTTLASATPTDPCQAWAPNPPDGAGNAKGPPASLQRPILSWSDGNDANTHDVYFGTSFAEVNDADTSSDAYIGPQGLADVNWTVDKDLPPLGQYYWRIDEVNATTVKGQVWDFTVANLGKASYPDPFDREEGVSTDKILKWANGIHATSHDVYFGTNFDDVNEATTSADPNNVYMGPQTGNTFNVKDYDPNALVFNTTYYWRIDEVDGGTYRGSVWRFTTAAHLTVEDFDSYVTNGDLWEVWDDFWVNESGSGISVEKEATFVREGNSIMFEYLNTYTAPGKIYIGSFIDANIADLEIGSDWTVSDARALVIYFYGQEDNSATVNDKMWVELEDTSSNTGVAIYDGDPNDVKEESWHEWNIDLAIFDACGVSLKNIDKVHLGFGNFYRTGQAEEGGSGTVYFDDIQVWPQRCVAVKASVADFTDDCIVDEYDLETMMEDWLLQDYNTLGYMGTLKGFTEDPLDPNYGLCWVPGRIGTGALEFGVGHVLTDPNCTNNCYEIHEPELDDEVLIPPLLLNTNTVSFTCWVKAHGPQWPDTALFHSDGVHGEYLGETVVGWDLGTNGISDMGYNWNNDTPTWNWNPEVPELPYNNWAFVALVIGETQARMYLKEDDNPAGLISDRNDENVHAPEPFDIPGHIGSHKWRYFDGVIDDFRIYNKTLSIPEVEWLAYEGNQGDDPTDANLYAHYKFDDGSGFTAEDSAGTGLNYWPVLSVANIAGDDIEPEYHRFVNLIDFAALADDWLVYKPWPRP